MCVYVWLSVSGPTTEAPLTDEEKEGGRGRKGYKAGERDRERNGELKWERIDSGLEGVSEEEIERWMEGEDKGREN